MEEVVGLPALIVEDPVTGGPLVVQFGIVCDPGIADEVAQPMNRVDHRGGDGIAREWISEVAP